MIYNQPGLIVLINFKTNTDSIEYLYEKNVYLVSQ
jgi:hypothetical protein